MDTNNLFDAIGYFHNLCAKNKLAKKNNFFACTCGGINSLDELLGNFTTQSAFFAVDDTNDGVTRRNSGGFFKHRTFTVFLLKRYKFGDMADRQKTLDICRQLFRQIHSRLLVDADDENNELTYLNTDNVMSREISEYFLNGCTGLYFMIDVSEPIDLQYNADEWE